MFTPMLFRPSLPHPHAETSRYPRASAPSGGHPSELSGPGGDMRGRRCVSLPRCLPQVLQVTAGTCAGGGASQQPVLSLRFPWILCGGRCVSGELFQPTRSTVVWPPENKRNPLNPPQASLIQLAKDRCSTPHVARVAMAGKRQQGQRDRQDKIS